MKKLILYGNTTFTKLLKWYIDNDTDRLIMAVTVEDKYIDLLEHPDDAKRLARQNIMMEQKLRANYRARYWEVTFFHTKALGQVPKDMHR